MIEHVDSKCKDQSPSTVFYCEDEALMDGDNSKKVSKLIKYGHYFTYHIRESTSNVFKNVWNINLFLLSENFIKSHVLPC
jgi:extradiol dioxygenase family protein